MTVWIWKDTSSMWLLFAAQLFNGTPEPMFCWSCRNRILLIIIFMVNAMSKSVNDIYVRCLKQTHETSSTSRGDQPLNSNTGDIDSGLASFVV